MMTYPERYEQWFDSPFEKRADRIEQQILGHLLCGVVPASATRALTGTPGFTRRGV